MGSAFSDQAWFRSVTEVKRTDVSTLRSGAWHFAPRGVQTASIPFGRIFDNVCLFAKSRPALRTIFSNVLFFNVIPVHWLANS